VYNLKPVLVDSINDRSPGRGGLDIPEHQKRHGTAGDPFSTK